MSVVTDPPQKPDYSQKEYLKRYLSKDKGVKKKKKAKISSSSHLKRSVIIDDDLGLPNVASVEDEDFNLDYLGDEAPQIAGIIDERPPEIKAKESYGDKSKWKPVGDPGGSDFVPNEHSMSNGQSNNGDGAVEAEDTFSWGQRKYPSESTSQKERFLKNDDDSDISPPRSKHKNTEKDYSFKRLSKHNDSSSSLNNKTKSHSNNFSQPIRRNKTTYDSDASPPRKSRYEEKSKRKGSDSSLSPPRKNKYKDTATKKGDDSDLSPPRKNKYGEKAKKREESDSDLSPPRKNKYGDKARRKGSELILSPPRKKKYEDRAKRKESDSDLSPPRKNKYEDRGKRKESDSDLSPPRKNKYEDRGKRKGSDSDLSPPRKNRYETKDHRKESNYDLSSSRKNRHEDRARRNRSDSDVSPPRKNKHNEKGRRAGSDSDFSPPRKNRTKERANRIDKTLDGKKAGLQDAKNLKEELRKLKEQEDALFEKMRASVSGKTAAAIKRDKKTGKIRDFDKEREEEVKKSARVTERENKYARWGKGLKQIEEAEERVADYLHEMNKPLARYADDQDLDKMLKAREREGDPMLDYIKNKQAESIDVDNRGKPTYQGYYLPNRFNIRPGHRWDGVDRSNGYEKQWFEKQNARKALQEEAYKWSTSDM